MTDITQSERRDLSIHFTNALEPFMECSEYDGFCIKDGYALLDWGGYEYPIELARIKTPENLLWWIVHLAEKEWEDMTPIRVRQFIIDVSNHNKFPTFFD